LLLCSIKGEDLRTAGEKRKNSVRFTFVQMGFIPGQVSAVPIGYEAVNKLKRAGPLWRNSRSL
jgi:hypothetical protein